MYAAQCQQYQANTKIKQHNLLTSKHHRKNSKKYIHTHMHIHTYILLNKYWQSKKHDGKSIMYNKLNKK